MSKVLIFKLLFLANPLYAIPFSVTLDTEFSGANPSVGNIVVNFDDTEMDKVKITIDASALDTAQKITQVYFNFNESLLESLSRLVFPDRDDSCWMGGNPPASPVPEPATMFLLGVGLVGLAGFGRKKFKK